MSENPDGAFCAQAGEQLAGLPGVQAVTHAVLAERGEWVTNEKTLIDRAGLRDVDAILAGLTAGPATLRSALDQAEALLG